MTDRTRPGFSTTSYDLDCGCQPVCCPPPCCCVPCPPPCGCGPVEVISFPLRDVCVSFCLCGNQLAPGSRVENRIVDGFCPIGVKRLSAAQILLEKRGAPYSVTYEFTVEAGDPAGSARVVPFLNGAPVDTDGMFTVSDCDAPAVLEFVVEGSCACTVDGTLSICGR